MSDHMIRCKKTGKGLAMKLYGGWCVCGEECIMEKELGKDWSHEQQSQSGRQKEDPV